MNNKPLISDEAVLEATGRSWREWFGLMESSGMVEKSRKEIVAELRDKHGVPSWWQHSIANAFEQSIGRRKKHQTDEGFQVSVSRTLAAPARTVFAAWIEDEPRAKWLRKKDFEVTAIVPPRSVRGNWVRDDSRLDLSVEEIEEGRCRLTIRHRKLRDLETAEAMRKFWKTAIDRLVAKAL